MLTQLLGLESRASVWNRALENPATRLTDEVLFGDSSSSDAGVSVSPRKALGYPPAWQAVNLISGDIAAMPFNLYRRRPDLGPNAREKAEDHPVHNLVRWSPYMGWHQVKFWRRLMVHALLWNNAYAVIQRNRRGQPVSMLPLLPDRTCPVDRDGMFFYVSEINHELVEFRASNILHIEGIAIEGTADCETITKLRDSIGLSLAAQKFASKFFRRGGRTGGVLEIPAEMKKKARDTVESGFRRTYEAGPDAAFMTFVARDNVKFHKAQFNAEEAQMQGTREEQALDASRIWNVPPHKLGIAKTVSYNSLEQENRSYHGTALVHWTVTIAAECRIKLLSTDEQEMYYFEHNTDSLLATDAMQRTQVAQMEIQMGTLSRDEYRAMVNRNPRGDGGGGFVESVQFISSTDEEETGDDSDAQEAARSVLEDAISRGLRLVSSMIRRKAKPKKATAFCEWFDNEFSQVSDSFLDEIQPSARAYACLMDWPAQEYAEGIAREIVDGLRRDVDNCLNCCRENELADSISEVLQVHSDREYRELIQWKSEITAQ